MIAVFFAVCSWHVFRMEWQLLVMKPTLLSLLWLSSTMWGHGMKLMMMLGWHTASVWLSTRCRCLDSFYATVLFIWICCLLRFASCFSSRLLSNREVFSIKWKQKFQQFLLNSIKTSPKYLTIFRSCIFGAFILHSSVWRLVTSE